MLIDLRPTNRLRGKQPIDTRAVLGPVLDALAGTDLDLGTVRVVCDWVQYRANFRTPIDLRTILGDERHGSGDRLEIALDLRQAAAIGPAQCRSLADAVLARHRDTPDAATADLYLEPWGPTSQSCLWGFNALYWRALELWEKATGRLYEQALPGGESDARNVAAAREMITDLFAVWDALAARNALPEELYVVELGVGNGHQAKVWLDEFRALDHARGGGYYHRLHYLLCDYSPHVLEMARTTVNDHSGHVSAVVLDATRPGVALAFLNFKVFLVYVSNVYDNLPSDEVARIGGSAYVVQSRAYLPAATAAELTGALGVSADGLARLIAQLLKLGPELMAEVAPDVFGGPDDVMHFWQAVWNGLRLAERYAPLHGLDPYEVAPGVSGEALRPLLESGEDIRMHVSNGAVASFADTLRLLHPYGTLVAHDLFVTDVDAYRRLYRGPGKYEGSVVNWVNGPLLTAIGRRNGFDVTYQPFRHRSGTNIVTLTARARD